jgi:PAS domain S-box-containing protein
MASHDKPLKDRSIDFLDGGGETGELMRARDWSSSPLGPPETWPQSLRSVVGLLLHSRFAMFVAWGEELSFLYNDAYAEILGAKHPRALGARFAEVWPEIWSDISPLIHKAMAGQATYRENLPLLMNRKGFDEQTWFTFSYSPLRDEQGKVAGMFCAVTETTDTVLAERRILAERERLRQMFNEAPGFMALLEGPDHRFAMVNRAYDELVGRRELVGMTVAEALPEVAGQGFVQLLDQVFTSGEPFVGRSTLVQVHRGDQLDDLYVDFVFQPLLAENGEIATIFVQGYDITDHKRSEDLRIAHNEVLELSIRDERLADTLDALVRTVEKHASPGVIASILLLDKTGRHLRHGAAPGLPAAYNEAIDGLEIGPHVGSCGTAAFTRQAVLVSDIATDPLWANFRDLALSHDLRACWSTPILSRTDDVLGTFAMYHREPRGPAPRDLELISMITRTSAMLIERKRADADLQEANDTLQTINRTGAVLAAELDLERVAQMVADAGVELTGAEFGAFFYKLLGGSGEARMQCRLSGARRSNLGQSQMPRRASEVEAAFEGRAVVRCADITADARYAQRPPLGGMLDGYPPARSYLGIPVTLRTGELLGGLFFSHREAARFTQRHEQLMAGVAAQAAVAIDNARLYQAARRAKETLEHRFTEVLAERKLLADIVETTDAFVQIVDLHFNWLGINFAAAAEFQRIFGIRPRVGDNMLELLADMPEHRVVLEQLWRRALGGEEFTEIAEFGDPDHARHCYEMKFNTLRDADGQLIGAYQFGYDVTERLRNQRRLAEAEDALRQSQKMEAVGQLVSGLAHDFNNLLGAVIGGLDLIRRRPDDPERVRRFAEAGLQAAERGSKLTGQLLAFSRSQRIELKPLIVCDVIENLRDMLARTLGPMIELEFALNPSPVPVLADATQVEMTILNLALNARDAMPAGGRLRIATALRNVADDPDLKPGEYVELSVADTGTGMDQKTLQRAMDPFFTTKPVGKGTGLGLAQIYGSARQSGGTVRIDSELGKGTTVRVLLPRTDMVAREPAEGEPNRLNGQPQRAKVLVVDDDPDLRGVLVSSFVELGYGVVEAADGSAALALLEEERPDVLVVDFAMPGMNGAEVVKTARERHSDLPVVLISGYADSEVIDRAVGVGAKVLRKPFRIEELVGALSDALNGA